MRGARWAAVVTLALAFCVVLPRDPTPEHPFRGCIAYRSQYGTPQWERAVVIGEYDATQWLVVLPDRIENAEAPRPIAKARFTMLCPASMWGNPLVPGADVGRRYESR